MAPASIPPTTEARDVFRELGYTVSEDGREFVAERKWRRVLVTVLCLDDDVRLCGGLFARRIPWGFAADDQL